MRRGTIVDASSGQEVVMKEGSGNSSSSREEREDSKIPVLTFEEWRRERNEDERSSQRKIQKRRRMSRYEKVRRGDFRFFDPFVDDGIVKYPAARIGLIVADETKTARRLETSLPVSEQRVVMSEHDVLLGKEHVKRKQLKMKVYSWPPDSPNLPKRHDGLSIPKDHTVEHTMYRAFPEDEKYEQVKKIECPIRYGDHDSKWKWRDPEVKYHTFLMQVSDKDMTTTYGHCFRWYRPCREPELKELQGPVAFIVLTPLVLTETVRSSLPQRTHSSHLHNPLFSPVSYPSLARKVLECYTEILNSRFALEHRYEDEF